MSNTKSSGIWISFFINVYMIFPRFLGVFEILPRYSNKHRKREREREIERGAGVYLNLLAG